MKNLSNLLGALFVSGGLAVIAPPVLHAVAAGSGDCIRGEYVVDDKCQGALVSPCKGPPECWKTATPAEPVTAD
jgi:hypothetical protein